MATKQPKPQTPDTSPATDFRAKIAALGRQRRRRTVREIERLAYEQACKMLSDVFEAAGVK